MKERKREEREDREERPRREKKEKDKEGEPVTGRKGRGNKLKNGFSLTAGPHYVQLHLFPF